VKIHLLYVIRGSGLARLYEAGEYRGLTQEEYVSLLVDFLELLPSHLVIHRVTGDPHREELLAPAWCLNKTEVLSHIHAEFAQRGSRQGSGYVGAGQGGKPLTYSPNPGAVAKVG
jgi:radical SAM superfamily enzyme